MTGNTPPPPAAEPTRSSAQTSIKGNLTPLQLTVLTALAIFFAEVLIMLILPLFGDQPVIVHAVLDSVLLTVIAAPVLSVLLLRPMVVQIEERQRAEQALRELNESLEQQVAERTRELERSNRTLKREIDERSAAEEQLQRTNRFVQNLIESAPSLMATLDVNTLKCNYVNGRIEDFLGHSPDDIMAEGGTLLDRIMEPGSSRRCREMIQGLIDAPQGEIARADLEMTCAGGRTVEFKTGIAVASRTAIGEAEEVLIVATPLDGCT
jgi:PAS domain-containing protein